MVQLPVAAAPPTRQDSVLITEVEPELELDPELETELESGPQQKLASAPEVESLPLAKGPFLDHQSLV